MMRPGASRQLILPLAKKKGGRIRNPGGCPYCGLDGWHSAGTGGGNGGNEFARLGRNALKIACLGNRIADAVGC